MATSEGPANTPPAPVHPNSVDPDKEHAVTVVPPALATKAVDPVMAMPAGPANPVPRESVHPDSVDPDTVHAVTVVPVDAS
jgi:hypothetical protein